MNRQERRAAAKQQIKTVAPQHLPQHFEAVKQGKSLFDLGRYAEALECFNLFEKHNPDIAPLYQTRGLCLQRLGRFEKAQADFERSIALAPGEAETHKNLGTLHSRFGRMEQALASIDRALELRPNFVAALNEKARALWSLQLLDEAFATFHRSLAVDPGNADTIWNLALLQMLTGDFERGWLGREARWKASSLGLVDRGFSQPLWLRDQPIEGKTILLHADEGLGDSIQFARYVPIVAALGAQIILEVPPPIQQLLGGITGVANCIGRSSSSSLAFDLHCPLGSLPLAFGTRLDTIPFAQAYLPAPPSARVKAWEDRLGPRNRFRVGLAWSGNPDHKNDHNRSMALRTLAPLLDCDVQFVSLQKGVRDQDRAFLGERRDIVDLTEQLTDFSETAALISCLDLVISVDTSVVHLAGALGTPVWTLLPFNPDWRWLLNRDDSPWYSSMRLFRQPKRGDWASVVDGVRLELERLVSAWRPDARQHQSAALPLKPEDALLSNYLGHQLRQLGRMDEAVLHFQQALQLYPQYLEAANSCGRLLFKLGRYAEALECLDIAEKLDPNSATLYQMRGACLQEANRFEEAEADYEKSIALDSSQAETHNNFGLLHSRLGRTEQAIARFDRALELRPDFSAVLNNKALALLNLHLLDEAFATLQRSLTVDPGNAPATFNLATLQLVTGDLERGWLGREARWKLPVGLPDRGFSQPLWLGDQPIEGKTILLHSEEGMGDAIQFARYAPMATALGARVILEVQPPIQQLLGGITGVAACIDRSSSTSLAFDLHCPLGTLPLVFGTRLDTIPFAEGYLPAPPAARVTAWEDRLGPRNRFRVGLVWSGNPDHKNDHNRSMALRALAPLLGCDVQFVSLQKGVRDQDRVFLDERPDIIDLTEQLTDFSETSALISCLDLVISVDTSVVHLAGALGVPVWTMLPFNPDWRWLLNRNDSPWYSSMRLFRQPKRSDWASVVDCVRLELERLVSAWRPEARQHQSKPLPPKPQDALLSNYLGYQLWQLGRMDEAVLHFQRALKLNPQYLDAANNCGRLLLDLGRYAEALEYFDVAEKLNPNSAALYQMRGVCLSEVKRFEEAEADYEKSVALDPSLAETHNNLGLLHWRSGRLEQAFACFDRALELRPDSHPVLNNKAVVLLDLQLLDEAFATLHRSLAVGPNDAETIFNLATLQLLTGDFERGWLAREARWRFRAVGLLDRGFSQSLWLRDQPIEGKTILLHSDEGLGDAIQFARYVPIVAALGARVILEVPPPIQQLLGGITGVANCIGRSSSSSLAFDLHCPLGSLPLAFGTRLDTIPFAEAYLPGPPVARVKAWEDRLGPRNRFRVGLVWSGNPDHKNDHNRSMALRTLAPLLDCDVQFVSLQKGVRDQDRALLGERRDIVDLTEQLADFSDTAALMSCLDLVISVDTSVVHLAGALGVPVWTMLPFNPDWRWLLNRDDSPWYSSMRLFRQPKRGDWASVVDGVRLELERLVSAWRPEARPHQSKALSPKPQDALLSNRLGYQLWQLGRMDEAVLHFQQALKLNPQYLEAANNCGMLLFDLGRYAEALECLDVAAKLNPNSAALYQMRGVCLLEAKRFEEAEADYEKSIALDSSLAETHSNLGLLHSRLGRMEQAFASIDRALELRPDFAAALANKAVVLLNLQLLDEAFETFHRSLAVDPNDARTIWNLAQLQMLTGDFERGLLGREARWRLFPVDRGFSQSLWLGDQPIEGKTILLHSDEGLGDSIQFARYAPMVAALGARVILEVAPPIQQLLGGIAGVANCIGRSSSTSLAFDLHCPLGSLPLAFGTRLDTIPFAKAYLPAPPVVRVKAWEHRLGPRNRLRVGLVWSGNPDHTNDHNRSMALRTLASVLDCDVQFVSLQKGVRDQDRAFLGERRDIIDLTEQLTDFSDTAALISCLDLVISVDTSVVHLAGALGVPVWTMLPFNPDWRWLLNRNDSPWYSSMRLFRQPKRGDWASVVDCVRLELESLASAWQPRQEASLLLPAE